MVKHVILWKLKDELTVATKDEAIAKIKADLEALGAAMVVGNATFVPSVRSLSLKDGANVEVVSLAEPSDVSRFLRVCQ